MSKALTLRWASMGSGGQRSPGWFYQVLISLLHDVSFSPDQPGGETGLGDTGPGRKQRRGKDRGLGPGRPHRQEGREDGMGED